MKMKSKRILVTGGAGFIGSHLVDALLKGNNNVSVLDNLSTGTLSNLEHVADRITFCKGDIRNQGAVMKAAKGCDVIFHQAAMVSVPQTVDNPLDSAMVNDMGTLHVLEAARKNRVNRIVLASSCAVYGDDPQLPKHESQNPKPQSPYAVQKLAGEYYARLYHDLYALETACLRYFNVFGPRQDPSSPYSGVISIFMTKAALRESPIIYGDGNQYRDFIFVMDVVKANLLAANIDDPGGRPFNIGTGSCISINRLWEMIRGMSNLDVEPKYEPSRPGDIRESIANIERAKSILGFKPEYSFSKGLEITFNWYNEMRMRKG